MSTYGGLIIVLLSGTNAQAPINDDTLLTEDGLDLLTEDSREILVETAN